MVEAGRLAGLPLSISGMGMRDDLVGEEDMEASSSPKAAKLSVA